jgi:hypothetical protein
MTDARLLEEVGHLIVPNIFLNLITNMTKVVIIQD